MKPVLTVGVLVVLLDQLIIAGLRIAAPNLIHSDPLVTLAPLLKVIASAMILAYLWLQQRRGNHGLVLVACGLCGNIVSLLIYQHYMDYIPTGFSYINSPDLLVTAGAIIYLRERFISSRT